MKFTKGMGSLVNDLIGTLTDSVNGLLTAADKAAQEQIDTIDRSIEDLNERLELRTTFLRTQFTRMEEAIAKMQGQAGQMAGLANKVS